MDNVKNMIKTINEIEGVNQLACSAHTLQLVVDKGLLPVKTLVVQASEQLESKQALLDQIVCSNINKNHEYLQAIIDVLTRWNSTYLAWVQILKLKPTIEIMQLMDDLVKILQSFANATKMLGGSKYTTILFMFTAISLLKKLLNIDNNIQITVDLDDSNTVFNDNLDLQENIKFIDEPEILDIEIEKKISRVKIKIPQNYEGMVDHIKSALLNALNYYWNYPTYESLLATILDSLNKKMEFTTDDQRFETKTYLMEEYKDFKNQS
ncbi:21218_t:CDS:2 [Cetraspora pellucida]|uniref:21218_t:CDS:1 n=1 Tax=Cetraspora pellucida TaxID=1433469 RepID=A0A9N9NIK5_9GLOM|nr:21218_t:CDS:2 [Cetraspora pellucida]